MAKTEEMTEPIIVPVAKRPLEEIIEEILKEPPVHLGESTAEIIRELRGPLPDNNDDCR